MTAVLRSAARAVDTTEAPQPPLGEETTTNTTTSHEWDGGEVGDREVGGVCGEPPATRRRSDEFEFLGGVGDQAHECREHHESLHGGQVSDDRAVPSPSEVSEYLVDSAAFKAVGTGEPRSAGSIPVHLRECGGLSESGGAKRRIPSTSANAKALLSVARNREERSDGSRPPPRMRRSLGSCLLLDGLEGRAHERRSPEIADESVEHVVHHVHDREVQIEIVDDRRTSPTSPEARTAIGR